MSLWVMRIIVLLVGYCFGLFLTGSIVAKYKKVDLRSQGSGNIGTTNAFRILGLPSGALTLIGDCLKCFIPVLAVYLIAKHNQVDEAKLLALYTGLGVIVGHDYPFFAKFKGGKGVASSLGLLLAFSPLMGIVAAVLFIIVVAISRYVSLGSIIALASLVLWYILFYMVKGDAFIPSENYVEGLIIIIILAALGIFRHRSNIKRLATHSENKFSFKRDK